jgi:glyoxylase-like metal-dependent hydrolase (beta-lactamase superfamily II)
VEIAADVLFVDGVSVAGCLRVIHIPGVCPSECVFYHEANGGMMLAGDVVMNGKEGLVFLPDNYCQDARMSRESARKLLAFPFETLTVAHGAPVTPAARTAFARLFAPEGSRGGVSPAGAL